MSRPIQTQLASKRCHGFRGRILAENRFGQIARQQFHANGDKQCDDDERQCPERDTFDNENWERIHSDRRAVSRFGSASTSS